LVERGKQLAWIWLSGWASTSSRTFWSRLSTLIWILGGFLVNLEAGEMVFTGKALSPARDVRSELVSRQVSQSYSW
jgi:hypothetical protein